MSQLPTALSTVGAILGVMALVAVVEVLVPLRARGRWHRLHLVPNLALTFLTFGSNLFLNAALVALLVWLEARGLGLLRWASLPPVAAGVVGFVLLDFSYYVAHVAMHEVPALWRVHRVHHSDRAVDVTTTIRQHPLEGLIRYAFMAACAAALGVGVGAFAIYRAWSVINGLFEHANVRAPRGLDAALSLVTTWPSLHKIHHSRRIDESMTNYGNIFSWFDRLLGTYTPPHRAAAVDCGVDGLDDPAQQTTRGLLSLPWRRP